MPGSFIDTNVLVYPASGDAVKADRAEAVIRAGGLISVQVLNEFAAVARRKLKMSWPEIAEALRSRKPLAVASVISERNSPLFGLLGRAGSFIVAPLAIASDTFAAPHHAS